MKFSLALPLFFSLILCNIAAAADYKWNETQGKSLALKDGDKVIWQFNYAAEESKPYFHPVALADGPVLTADAPPDHPWHKSLWFSWKLINGVNYWEYDSRTGKPGGVTGVDSTEITKNDDGTVTIVQQITYKPSDGDPVMKETRTVKVSAPDENGEYHFDWTCKFTPLVDVVLDRTPLPGEPGGQTYGGYAGLSIRLTQSLEEAEIASTEGPVEFAKDQRHRSKADAFDYSGIVDDKPVGFAVCDHPDNVNSPSPWYTINTPGIGFYYINAAVLCYGKLERKADESFTLRYRVIAHHDRWNSQKLQTQYEQFVKQP